MNIQNIFLFLEIFSFFCILTLHSLAKGFSEYAVLVYHLITKKASIQLSCYHLNRQRKLKTYSAGKLPEKWQVTSMKISVTSIT